MLTCVVPALAQTVTAAALAWTVVTQRESPLCRACCRLGIRSRASRVAGRGFSGRLDSLLCVLAPSCRSVGGSSGKSAPDSSELRGRAAEAGGRSGTVSASARPSRAAAPALTATPGSLPSVRRRVPVTLAREGWPRQAVNVPVTRASADAEEGTASRCSAWGPWGDRTWAACPPAAAVRVQMRRGQRTSSGVTHAARSPGRHRAHSRLSGEHPS